MTVKALAALVSSSTLGLTVLAGCSSTSDGWTKAGMTKEGLDQDTADCLLNSRSTVPSREGPRIIVDQDRYRRCMADRGYTAGPAK